MKRVVTTIITILALVAVSATPALAATVSIPTRPGDTRIAPTRAALRTPRKTVVTPPVTRVSRFFGAYVHGAPDSMAPVDDLEAKVNSQADVVNFYVASTEGFPVNRTKSIVANGSIPLITLEFWDYTKGVNQPSYSLKSIAGGAHDAEIRAFAQGAKAAGTTIWVRPLHEMNGNWYPWAGTVNGNTPADYAPAWRHIVDVFRAQGATNVKFVWCPNNDNVGGTTSNTYASYWPGETYVDSIALDGYNFGGSSWRTFTTTFAKSYAAVAALSASKPIFIAEIGCATGATATAKSAWVADMFKVIPTSFPRIGGVVWFDTTDEADFRIQSDAYTVSAFKTGLATF
jgi:beta-mannanase